MSGQSIIDEVFQDYYVIVVILLSPFLKLGLQHGCPVRGSLQKKFDCIGGAVESIPKKSTTNTEVVDADIVAWK